MDSMSIKLSQPANNVDTHCQLIELGLVDWRMWTQVKIEVSQVVGIGDKESKRRQT